MSNTQSQISFMGQRFTSYTHNQVIYFKAQEVAQFLTISKQELLQLVEASEKKKVVEASIQQGANATWYISRKGFALALLTASNREARLFQQTMQNIFTANLDYECSASLLSHLVQFSIELSKSVVETSSLTNYLLEKDLYQDYLAKAKFTTKAKSYSNPYMKVCCS